MFEMKIRVTCDEDDCDAAASYDRNIDVAISKALREGFGVSVSSDSYGKWFCGFHIRYTTVKKSANGQLDDPEEFERALDAANKATALLGKGLFSDGPIIREGARSYTGGIKSKEK